MKYVIGNWKSNQNLTESLIWIDGIHAIKPQFSPDISVILCLPFTDIAGFNHKLSMLGELVSFCLVGHSERRHDFGETSAMVAEKAKLLLENAITPIVCLDLPYLDEQIKALFQNNVDVSRCFFVYEPIAAIGTGKPMNPTEANHTAHQISFLLDNVAPVLYGGSVTADNVKSFVDQSRIDGVLVGTDSLEPTLFAGVINSLT
jgi:triosephosphate isomerase